MAAFTRTCIAKKSLVNGMTQTSTSAIGAAATSANRSQLSGLASTLRIQSETQNNAIVVTLRASSSGIVRYSGTYASTTVAAAMIPDGIEYARIRRSTPGT